MSLRKEVDGFINVFWICEQNMETERNIHQEDERKGQGLQIRDGKMGGWRSGCQRSRGGRRGQQWSQPVRPFEVSMCVTALMSAWECVSACVLCPLHVVCGLFIYMCRSVCVLFPMYNKYWSSSQCRPPSPLQFEGRQCHTSVMSGSVCLLKSSCRSYALPAEHRGILSLSLWQIFSSSSFFFSKNSGVVSYCTSQLHWFGNVTWAVCQSLTLVGSLHKQKQSCVLPLLSFILQKLSKLLQKLSKLERMTDSWARPTPQWWVWHLWKEKQNIHHNPWGARCAPAYLCSV